MLAVVCPADAHAGSVIPVTTPSGAQVLVTVPGGVQPGHTFHITVPSTASSAQLLTPARNRLFAELETEKYVPLDDVRFDVTNHCEALTLCILAPCCGWRKVTLTLGDQEATLRSRNWCGSTTQRRPYAHLGEVTLIKTCCGSTVSSDLARANEKGEGGLQPGWCGDTAMVSEIVREMQARKLQRGHVAQLKKLEHLYQLLLDMRTNLPLVFKGLGVKYTEIIPYDADAPATFSTKEYDVSGACVLCECKSLRLESEEAVLERRDCCTSTVRRREYAQLGSVQRLKCCVCCRGVGSELGVLSPGCGCQAHKVAEIIEEMQERMVRRGTMGQIRKQEKMLKQIDEVARQVDALMDRLQLPYPPTQQVMQRWFSDEEAAPPKEGSGKMVPTNFSPSSYEVTNKLESACAFCCTCGVVGCEKDSLELEADHLVFSEENRIDSASMKMPYAQIDSVDLVKDCCCCYRVNFIQPGYGCDKETVEEVAQKLQDRKVHRGNIAQLSQLRGLNATALELDMKTATILEKMGVSYPPSDRTAEKLYGNPPPHVLKSSKPPHPAPTADFDVKSFDTTDYVESLAKCVCTLGLAGPCTVRKLELLEDELHMSSSNWCCTATERTPYAQLGSVEVETQCCCCIEVPEVVSAGCGCDKELTEEIARELQDRKVKRGNIAHIKLQENLMTRVLKLRTMIDTFVVSRGLTIAPAGMSRN